MKLSIVIPLYNKENYIEKCIKSILINKNKEFEVIIVDDGSTDNSGKICQKLIKEDNRLKYFYKRNGGCSSARNYGIKISKGEYIWFIDSDDCIKENAIDRILELLFKKECLILFGYQIICKNGNIIKRIPKKIEKLNDIYNQYLFFNSSCNKIYKKEIILENNIQFLENCHMGEDLNFNFKFFYYLTNLKIEKEIYYNYYEADGVTSNINKRMEIFLAFDDIFQFFKNKEDFKKMRKILEKYYKINVIRSTYDAIIRERNRNKDYNSYNEIRKVYLNIKNRKKFFKKEFKILQLIYLLKYISYPLYVEIIKYKKYIMNNLNELKKN